MFSGDSRKAKVEEVEEEFKAVHPVNDHIPCPYNIGLISKVVVLQTGKLNIQISHSMIFGIFWDRN